MLYKLSTAYLNWLTYKTPPPLMMPPRKPHSPLSEPGLTVWPYHPSRTDMITLTLLPEKIPLKKLPLVILHSLGPSSTLKVSLTSKLVMSSSQKKLLLLKAPVSLLELLSNNYQSTTGKRIMPLTPPNQVSLTSSYMEELPQLPWLSSILALNWLTVLIQSRLPEFLKPLPQLLTGTPALTLGKLTELPPQPPKLKMQPSLLLQTI